MSTPYVVPKIVSTYVLVDQHDRNVLPLPSELVESLLDSGLLGLRIDNEVVLLGVRSLGDVLYYKSASL